MMTESRLGVDHNNAIFRVFDAHIMPPNGHAAACYFTYLIAHATLDYVGKAALRAHYGDCSLLLCLVRRQD